MQNTCDHRNGNVRKEIYRHISYVNFLIDKKKTFKFTQIPKWWRKKPTKRNEWQQNHGNINPKDVFNYDFMMELMNGAAKETEKTIKFGCEFGRKC